MKKITFFTFFLCLYVSTFAQLNTMLQSVTDYTPRLNDIWGYSAGGSEYALVGLRGGVNILDITDPANPVDKGTATGPNSTWRDIKTFGSYAYVINENADGLLIIDLSGLPTAITSSDWSYWEPNITDLGGTLSTCHNIYIDGNGYGYLAGCNRNSGGVIYIDLFTTPGSPQYVDKAPATYAHDVYVQNNKMYTSDIYAGKFSIYDVANKSSTIFEGDQTTPDDFTHNAWTDGGGSVIFTTDEVSNASVASYDISDPNNIIALDEFRPLATINTGVVPHNVHVINDYLVISHYSDGLVIVDASVPENMIEVGNYDTCTGNCSGAWGAYPFLPSGNILISDMNEGCFVVTPTYIRAARLKGKITDAQSGANLSGVKVTMDAVQANEDLSDFSGDYATGVATAGTYNVTFEKAGYTTLIVSATISNGTETVLDVQLGDVNLAIELTRFTAERTAEDEVSLSWEAQSNDAFISFDIQRSLDGINFENIGKVEDDSPSLFTKVYDHIDEAAPAEDLYYRLNMVEPSGKNSLSPIRFLEGQLADQKEIKVYPNPLKSGHQLNLEMVQNFNGKNLAVEYYNSTGQLVDQLALDPQEAVVAYDTSLLPAGVYFLKFTADGQTIQVERLTVD